MIQKLRNSNIPSSGMQWQFLSTHMPQNDLKWPQNELSMTSSPKWYHFGVSIAIRWWIIDAFPDLLRDTSYQEYFWQNVFTIQIALVIFIWFPYSFFFKNNHRKAAIELLRRLGRSTWESFQWQILESHFSNHFNI